MIASTTITEEFTLSNSDEWIHAATKVDVFEICKSDEFVSGIACLCRFAHHADQAFHWVDLFFLTGENLPIAKRIQDDLDQSYESAIKSFKLRILSRKYGLDD